MKRKIVVMIICLCVFGACGCSSDHQAKNEVDTQLQVVNSENTETTENIATESLEEASEASSVKEEAKVISFEPDSPLTYRGKELQLSYQEDSVKIKYGDAEYEIKDYVEWIDTGYILEIDDTSFYTIIQVCSVNDWVTSYIVKYNGNTLDEIAVQNGGVQDASSISGNQITFNTRADVFGTYGVKIPMRLENDQLTSVDDIIKFYNEPDPEIYDTLDSPEAKAIYNKEGYRVLTLKRTLKAMSDDGEIEIGEGEQIIPYGFDEKEKKFYFIYHDKQYYFTYEEGDGGYPLTIDGVDQDDMFVYLPYAG